MDKIAFLDRDGIINYDKGYIFKKEDFLFRKGIFKLCKQLQFYNYKIIVITNQSGIARGLYTELQFKKLNDWMLNEFTKRSVLIDKVFFCPYHPDGKIKKYKLNSDLRKPNIGMIKEAEKFHQIDFKRSLIIGDKETDIECGHNAGLRYGFLINKNFNNIHFSNFKSNQKFNYYIFSNLEDLSKKIEKLN